MDSQYVKGLNNTIYAGIGLSIGFMCVLDLSVMPLKTFQAKILLLLGFGVLFFHTISAFRTGYLSVDPLLIGTWLDLVDYGSIGIIFSMNLYLCVCRYNSFVNGRFKVPMGVVYVLSAAMTVITILFGIYWLLKVTCNASLDHDFCPGTIAVTGQVPIVFGISHSISSVILLIFDIAFLSLLFRGIYRVRERSIFNAATLHQIFFALAALAASLIDSYYSFGYVAKTNPIFNYNLAFLTYSVQFLSLAKLGLNVSEIIKKGKNDEIHSTPNGISRLFNLFRSRNTTAAAAVKG